MEENKNIPGEVSSESSDVSGESLMTNEESMQSNNTGKNQKSSMKRYLKEL